VKKLFELLGAAVTFKTRGDPIRDGFAPYGNKAINSIYNLLFCDKLEVFRKDAGENPQGVWATLLAKEPSADALRTLANDQAQESRVRALAFHRLREMRQAVPERQLLGVIVEVAMAEGLDVLAAYPDGRVRYINHKAKLAIFEPVPTEWLPKVRRLMTAATDVIERIGPWEQPRIAPPTFGMIRMSFLVSDGLYFGQGPMAVMEKDEIAQPIIAASVELLKLVAEPVKS
jgi:hypothetical protein